MPDKQLVTELHPSAEELYLMLPLLQFLMIKTQPQVGRLVTGLCLPMESGLLHNGQQGSKKGQDCNNCNMPTIALPRMA